MKTRIISGICMVPLLLVVYFGGIPLLIAAAAISYIGVTEFFNGFNNMEIRPSRKIAYCMITILYVGFLVNGHDPVFLMGWILLSITASLLYGWDIVNRSPEDSMATLTGIVYIVFFAYHIVLIDHTAYSELVWLVLIAAFGSDIMAYFTGYAFGKHKLCPNLSPKKTIEGAIGGALGATVFGGLFGYFFMPGLFHECLIMGLVGGIVSQCGDLTASAFKRKMGIKDYGHLIPGHGGIMDRFDSVIFVAPFIYYSIVFILP